MVLEPARIGALPVRLAPGPDRSGRPAPRTCSGGGAIQRLVPSPAAYFIEYADGTRATLLMLNGAAGRLHLRRPGSRSAETRSRLQFLLPPNPNVAYSACLMQHVEAMIETGRAPYPVERTLLVSGMLESCLDSKIQGHARLETPHLAVHYQPPSKAGFCGG